MNGAASPGQQRLDRQQVEVRRRRRSRTTSWHGPDRTVFGIESAIDFSFVRPLHLLARGPAAAASRARPASRCADLVQALDAEREAHPPLGAELVDQQRVLGALGVLEEQRRPARLDGAVDDLGDLEIAGRPRRRRGRARPRARAARSSRGGRGGATRAVSLGGRARARTASSSVSARPSSRPARTPAPARRAAAPAKRSRSLLPRAERPALLLGLDRAPEHAAPARASPASASMHASTRRA